MTTEHTPEQERYLYLVQGGSPAARMIAAALDDPEQRARLEAWARETAERIGAFVDDLVRALVPALAEWNRQIEPLVAQLREAGLLPEVPPEDPRARALWLRQHRGTGPSRQVQHERRPRRVS